MLARLASFAVLLLGASALPSVAAQPALGIGVGPTLGRLDKVDGADSPMLVGLTIGVTAEAQTALPVLSVQVGARYAEKGESDPDGAPPYRNVKLSYLEIPVALVVHAPVGGVEARVSAGGFYGWRVASDVGQQSGTFGTTRGWDAGLLVGVGARSGAVVADVRYEHGLHDVQQSGVPVGSETRTVSLTLGYRL